MFSKVIIITSTIRSIAPGGICPNEQTDTFHHVHLSNWYTPFHDHHCGPGQSSCIGSQFKEGFQPPNNELFFLLFFRFLLLSSQQQRRGLLPVREQTTRRRRRFSLLLMTILVFFILYYSGVSVVFAVLVVIDCITWCDAQRRRVLFPYPLFSKITWMYPTSIFIFIRILRFVHFLCLRSNFYLRNRHPSQRPDGPNRDSGVVRGLGSEFGRADRSGLPISTHTHTHTHTHT